MKTGVMSSLTAEIINLFEYYCILKIISLNDENDFFISKVLKLVYFVLYIHLKK